MGYYEDLEVRSTATDEEIRSTYKRLARLYHPDMNPGDEKDSAEKFKVVATAYEVLSDPAKRTQYDTRGYVGRRPPPGGKPQPKPNPKPRPKTNPKPRPGPKKKEEFEKERREKDRTEKRWVFEPADIKCDFFGGDGRGRSILVQLQLTEQEMKQGGIHKVWIKKKDFCIYCGGDGTGWFPCPRCGNRGLDRAVCGHCHTRGELHSNCPKCAGSGVGGWMVEEMKFKVSPNAQVGHQINIMGAGEIASGKPPGNVRVVLT